MGTSCAQCFLFAGKMIPVDQRIDSSTPESFVIPCSQSPPPCWRLPSGSCFCFAKLYSRRLLLLDLDLCLKLAASLPAQFVLPDCGKPLISYGLQWPKYGLPG